MSRFILNLCHPAGPRIASDITKMSTLDGEVSVSSMSTDHQMPDFAGPCDCTSAGDARTCILPTRSDTCGDFGPDICENEENVFSA